MEKLTTVISFHLLHEAHLAKAKLESEGIEVFLQNELSVQTYNFVADAIGGIQLQVKESDVEAACEILKEAGYFQKPEIQNKEWFERFANASRHWPLLGKLKPQFRLFILILLMLFVLIAPLML